MFGLLFIFLVSHRQWGTGRLIWTKTDSLDHSGLGLFGPSFCSSLFLDGFLLLSLTMCHTLFMFFNTLVTCSLTKLMWAMSYWFMCTYRPCFYKLIPLLNNNTRISLIVSRSLWESSQVVCRQYIGNTFPFIA